MLTNFPTPKTYNLAGLRAFKFIPRVAISTYPGIFNSKILTPITVNSGFAWFNGYATPKTLVFTEEVKESDNGKYYEQQIAGFAPGDRLDLIDLMDLMDDQDFIVQIKDSNNQNRIVGTHGFPLTFSSSYTSGSGIEEAKGYNFKFSGVSIFRAPVY